MPALRLDMSGDGEIAFQLIRDTSKAVSELVGQVGAMSTKVDRNTKVIDGNGQEGVLSRLTAIEGQLEAKPEPVVPDSSAKWEAIGKWATPIAAFGALALAILDILTRT